MKRLVALLMALSLTVGCGKTPGGSGGIPSSNQLAAILSIVAVTYPMLVNQSQGINPAQIGQTFMGLAASGVLGPQAQAILSDPKNQQLISTLMVALQGGPQAQAALSQFISFGTPAQTAQSLSNILTVLQVAAPAMGVTLDPATQTELNLLVAMLPVVIQLVNSAAPKTA